MPMPWQEFGWGEVDEPGPQTESSIERGFRLPGPIDDQWGRSENLDPDDVGDIADEGAGHRGKAAGPMRRGRSASRSGSASWRCLSDSERQSSRGFVPAREPATRQGVLAVREGFEPSVGL